MNIIHILVLVALPAWLLPDRTAPQSSPDSFPVPPASANRLFYIQRSKDTNTIVYEANLTPDGTLDARMPVRVYWIRYADHGQQEDLTAFQWRMAYGYKHQRGSQGYTVSLNALRKRSFDVMYLHGRPVAMITINGRSACLQRIFVQIASPENWIPNVQYIDVFGTAPDTGAALHERIYL